MRPGGDIGRRAFIGGVATALAGCVGAGGTERGRDGDASQEPVSLAIKTTPADDDPYGMRIARTLSENLEAVGVRTDIVPMAMKELLESVLVDHDFDLYVARHPGGRDPDYLRSLFHAENVDERGWRNPFGVTESTLTDLLSSQRYQRGEERTSTVHDLLTTIAEIAPMTVLARPDTVHAIRTDRVVDWPTTGIRTPGDLLDLHSAGDSPVETVRIAVTDDRSTRNRNPLAFAFRDRGLITGLLYEPLCRWTSSGLEPGLAREWVWTDHDDGSQLSFILEDASWHDGKQVTADDVAFTYRFIADTSLGSMDDPVPAPMFRGRSELVDTVAVLDERTLSVTFSASREVARRALTLPILPEHEWRPRAEPADVAGLSLFGETTEALRWDNPEPVGSGPLAFESAEDEQSLHLTRFEDYFAEGPAFEQLMFRVAPSDAAAIELVVSDEVDGTGPIDASLASRIARSGDAMMMAGKSISFYHIGFNVREPPLDDRGFRQAVGALVDRREVVDRIFDGFASSATVPLDGKWKPDEGDLKRIGPAEIFPGDPGDLDHEAAIDAFWNVGYRRRDDGAMISIE